MLCFMYIGDEPLFTIGPDFKFTILEIALFNVISFLPIRSIPTESTWFEITTGLLLLQNISFLFTVLWNPKIVPLNPLRNSMEYLKRISNKNLESKICKKCELIHGEFDKNVSHC